MRKLGASEIVVQVWAQRDPAAQVLIPLVSSIAESIDHNPKLGQRVGEVEGPTPPFIRFLLSRSLRPHSWLFNLCARHRLFLLKAILKEHEYDPGGNRLADIDLLLSEYKKVSAKNGKIEVVNIRQY